MAVGISASGAILSQEGDAAAMRGAMPTAALAEAAREQIRSRDRDFGGGWEAGLRWERRGPQCFGVCVW